MSQFIITLWDVRNKRYEIKKEISVKSGDDKVLKVCQELEKEFYIKVSSSEVILFDKLVKIEVV